MKTQFHALVLLCSLVCPAAAQYTTGRIEGAVLDPSSALVEDAQLTLTSVETNSSRTLSTSSEGLYAFSAVSPGAYRLTTTKAGFRPATAELVVYTSQTTTQDFRLELGDQPVAISVSAEAAALVNTTEPLRQVTRDSLELSNLPNSRRDLVNVIVLSPGVTPMVANPCSGVEFPVRVRGLFRPHYVTWSEQQKIEASAPDYLGNAVRIITETGLRVYKELAAMKKADVDLANAVVWIPDSKTASGVAEVPLTELAVDAFRKQMSISGPGPYLFFEP